MNILYFPRFGPVLDDLDFARGHSESVLREDVAEIFDFFFVKLTFIGVCIQSVFSETSEDLTNVGLVIGKVVGVDQDVVQIDYNADI